MAILQEQDAELRGDRVVIIARRIDPPVLSTEHRSGRHKRMTTKARDEVRCILEQPYKFILDKPK